MNKFRNAIFDLDGLICDTEPLYQRAANLILQVSNVSYQFETDEYGRVMTGRAVLKNAEYLRERFGLAASAEDIEQGIFSIFNILVSDASNIQAMPGFGALLDFLRAEQAKLAIASGSRPEHIVKMLRALELTTIFPIVAGTDNGIKHKPAPDIYLKALNELHANPSETFALEDSVSGLRAARAAGLFVIAVRNNFTRHHDLSDAHMIVENLFEVKEYLSREG